MASVPLALNNDGRPIRLRSDARNTHMHVLGISGTGKTRFLENLIRSDIKAGHGVTVIDPSGDLYDRLVKWIVANRYDEARRVHLLNPSDTRYAFGFNPLAVKNGTGLSYRVEALLDGILAAWDGGDLSQTPRLAKCLLAVLYLLAEHNLSLTEARKIVRRQYKMKVSELAWAMENEAYRDLWQEFVETYSDRLFAEYFESTDSRLLRFLGDPIIADIVGQTEGVIDFRQVMDDGDIVLVNLATRGQLSESSARTLASVLINDLYTTAFSRDVEFAQYRPHYLYIDECHRYLSDDIVGALDESRKYGLHLVLSHQRTGQLEKRGADIYNGVMAGAQLKVVFNPNDTRTAQALAELFFAIAYDLEKPKESMIRPTVVGHSLEWFESKTTSRSWISGRGETSGEGIATAAGLTQGYSGSSGQAFDAYTMLNTQSTSSMIGHNRFEAVAEGEATTQSPILVPQFENLPTQLYSLEEMRHLGATAILRLAKREAWVCSPWLEPFRVSTIDTRSVGFPDDVIDHAVVQMYEKSPYIHKRQDVHSRRAAREERAFGDTVAPQLVPDDGFGH